MVRKAAEFVQFKLRVSEKMRRDIEREAKKNHRSANAEAVERLEKSFETSAVRPADSVLRTDSPAWDTFITMMIGGNESADFLRWLALQMRDINLSDAGSRGLMIEKIKDRLEAQ
jgi:Arc-like DNA binding dprotein